LKAWQRYAVYLLTGEWHIHTNYTDGENSVEEYCQKAVEMGVPLLVFSEHVRRSLDYDFHAFLGEVEAAKKKYPKLIILTGCEAKVLESGELDAAHETLSQCEIVLMAFHSFPRDTNKYLAALKVALANPLVSMWAHPGLFLARNNMVLGKAEIEEITDIACRNDVLIETNAKHEMPPHEWVQLMAGRCTFVRGSDVHSLNDLQLRNDGRALGSR